MKQSFSCKCFCVIDRVYRGDCSTREVYEEGARGIALSVVNGINGTYGNPANFFLPFLYCVMYP